MDACKLTFADNFFDLAIDKSTIDALLCGDNSYVITALMLKESQRVIKENGGVYFAISYGKPSTRSMHFKRPFLSWDLKEFSLLPQNEEFKDDEEKDEKSHYIYVCTKNKRWRDANTTHFEKEIIELILHEKNLHLGKTEESDDFSDSTDLFKSSLDFAKAKVLVARPNSR